MLKLCLGRLLKSSILKKKNLFTIAKWRKIKKGGNKKSSEKTHDVYTIKKKYLDVNGKIWNLGTKKSPRDKNMFLLLFFFFLFSFSFFLSQVRQMWDLCNLNLHLKNKSRIMKCYNWSSTLERTKNSKIPK